MVAWEAVLAPVMGLETMAEPETMLEETAVAEVASVSSTRVEVSAKPPILAPPLKELHPHPKTTVAPAMVVMETVVMETVVMETVVMEPVVMEPVVLPPLESFAIGG